MLSIKELAANPFQTFWEQFFFLLSKKNQNKTFSNRWIVQAVKKIIMIIKEYE